MILASVGYGLGIRERHQVFASAIPGCWLAAEVLKESTRRKLYRMPTVLTPDVEGPEIIGVAGLLIFKIFVGL